MVSVDGNNVRNSLCEVLNQSEFGKRSRSSGGSKDYVVSLPYNVKSGRLGGVWRSKTLFVELISFLVCRSLETSGLGSGRSGEAALLRCSVLQTSNYTVPISRML